MALTLYHTFEAGQSSGTTITTGNSGTGGTAFNATNIGTGATLTYDGTAPRGSLCMRATTTGTSSTCSASWTSAITSTMSRAYGRMTVSPATLAVTQAPLRTRAATVQVFRVTLNTAGKWELRNSANTVLVTATTAMTTSNTWRIAWDVTVGASATGVLYIYHDPTSTTPDETLTANSANFGSTNIDEANWGQAIALTNGDIRLDDIVLTDQGLPGPAQQTITINETISLAEAIARGLAAPRAVSEGLTVADAVGRGVAVSRPVSESLTLADGSDRVVSLLRSVSETVTVADGVVRGLVLPRSVAEGLVVADAVDTAVSSRIVTRPSTGTTARPSSGLTARPYAGTTTRP